jgi:histidine triad (HIT) family protein
MLRALPRPAVPEKPPAPRAKTLFQKIADREIPGDLVYEDDRCVAFRDIQPAAPVHVLVVPRKPIPRADAVEEADEALVGHLFTVARRVAAEEGLSDYRLVVNNGAGAGQSVFHLHLHLLGGRPLSWPPG